jgi:hypothetical protein
VITTRRFLAGLLALAVMGLAVLGYAYATAVADPVVRRTKVSLADWPVGARPIEVLLISDIHVTGPDMPPERLARIVSQINRLAPDLVLLAGDFIGDKGVSTRHYPVAEALAPLRGLRAPAIAVLGNHDHWRSAAETRAAMAHAGIVVLDNAAISAGPLNVGGLDDDFTDRADLPAMLAAMEGRRGARVILSHSPDPFPNVPGDVGLMLAGHTHCGQIRLPWYGAVSTMSEYGDRYACGRVDEAGKTLIVGAGVGTSILPLRLGAVPDMWLIALGPRRQ